MGFDTIDAVLVVINHHPVEVLHRRPSWLSGSEVRPVVVLVGEDPHLIEMPGVNHFIDDELIISNYAELGPPSFSNLPSNLPALRNIPKGYAPVQKVRGVTLS